MSRISSGVYLLAGLLLCNIAVGVWGVSLRPASAVAPAAAPPLPETSLILLDENPDMSTSVTEANPETEFQQPGLVSTPELICRAWGPYSELEEVESLAADLRPELSGLSIRQSEVRGKPDYLVYVTSSGSRDQARRVLRELKSQSIESAIISLGDIANALSVGVFSQPSRAEAQRERVASLGYAVDIEELARAHQIFHLTANVSPDAVLERPADGLCSEIAPDTQFL